MGALRAGFHGTVGQSSAQVIDGSLNFDGGTTGSSNQYLEHTFSSDGNRRTFTMSFWLKRSDVEAYPGIFFSGSSSVDPNNLHMYFNGDTLLLYSLKNGSNIRSYNTTQQFRDTSGWYHIVVAVDSTISSPALDRFKVYVNGDRVTEFSSSNHNAVDQNTDFSINQSGKKLEIGLLRNSSGALSYTYNGNMSQWYFIDGQALGPGYFGFTDPLTKTWRPKKYTGTFGTNGFYLPFDGNSPIGEDKSGIVTPNNGSIWSNSLTSSSGFRSSEPKTNAFDGNTSSICSAVGSGTITFTSPVTFASDSTIKVFLHGGDHTVTVNGGSDQTISAGSFQTVTYSNSGNATFVMTFHRGGGADTGVRAIEINGVILTDNLKGNSSKPINFGGSNSVDKASGALPILNTVSGGHYATVGVRTDANAANLVLALPLVGNKEDVVASINSAQTNVTVTNNGSVPFQTTQSNFYGGSAFFEDSSSDNLTFTNFGSRFEFTGDYTIEAWIYPTDSGAADGSIFVENSGSNYFAFNFDPGTQFNIYNNESTPSWSPSTNLPPVNKWSHIALVRSGSIQKIYVNGNSIATNTASGTHGYASPSFARIGGGASSGLDSYIQDLRVYKGVAKYTSNFVPASTNPDILPDTPSGVSGGSKLTKITDGAVSFDGTGDYLGLANTTDVNFGSGDFTWECFAYFHTVTGSISLMGQWENGPNRRSWLIQVNDGKLQSYVSSSGNAGGDAKQADSPANYMAPKRWYHIAVTRSGDDMKLFIDGELITTTDLTGFTVYSNTDDGFSIGSQKSSASNVMNGYISNARIIKGTALYTSRFTPPTRALTNVTNTKLLCCQSPTNVRLSPVAKNVGITTTTRFNSNFESIPTTVNGLTVTNNGSVTTTSAGTNSYGFTNCADLTASNSLSVDLGTIPALSTIDIIFKATGATDNKYLFGIGGNGMVRRSSSNFVWYNGSDTTISTSEIVDGNWHHLRITPTRLFFDNTLITNSTSLQFINNNTTGDGDNSGHMALGAFRNGSGTIQYNASVDFGLVRVMPGVDLGAPSSYPITTNGTLSDTETIPSDGIIITRGNPANSLLATGLNPFNTDINTVRGQETGYCTLNPLHQKSATISENNLKAQVDSSGSNYVVGTVAVTSGQWYWEFTTVGSNNMMLGAAKVDATSYDISSTGNVFYYYANGGNIWPPNSSYGSTLSVGDTLGVALDMDAGTLTYYKNGVSLGVAFNSGLSGETIVPSIGTGGGSGSITRCNFGQKPFKFPPPDGFQPLNTANTRPVKVISRPDQYVGVTTYTGDNTASKKIDNLLFSPDLVWVKDRELNFTHFLNDTVRGAGKILQSNASTAETDNSDTIAAFPSFNSNGFTVGTNVNWQMNGNNEPYVGWCWKAGGSKNTFNVDDVGYATAAAAGLNGGDITPTGASVGTKQGFSIIEFTGSASGTPSISHGLSEAPNFIIQKDTGATTSWRVFMYNGTTWSIMNFDDASGAQGATETAPTSSLFYANGNGNAANKQIAYLWHDVPGLQKFGTFEGNGNANGPFIELGFRPSIILMRNLDNYGTNYDWCIYDNERAKFNPNNKFLCPNLSKIENRRGDNTDHDSRDVDFHSNGFKIRNTASTLNLNSHTIFYAAWAEAPTIDLYGGGANAR